MKVPEAEAEEGIGGVSIRRADYWLVEATESGVVVVEWTVSIRRADYWLVEEGRQVASPNAPCKRFNPPGGLLVG